MVSSPLKNKLKTLITALLLNSSNAIAQIPVEVFGGNEKATIDIMFFKFFKTTQGENSRWLFFNRNRASIDYRMTKTEYLPQFGFTEALSYNHPKLKGFAPAFVGQVLSWGVYPKAGIQYARIKKEITVFTWLVCETLKYPTIDYFLLTRYTPKLSDKINLYTQFESLNTMPTSTNSNYIFTQRIRFGISVRGGQFGVGADLIETGKNNFTYTYNVGGFLRHEF